MTLETIGETAEALFALLPEHLVRVRKGTVTAPHMRSLAEGIIMDALVKGYEIDRSNGDGPLDAWDGWLVVHTPELLTFIETQPRSG